MSVTYREILIWVPCFTHVSWRFTPSFGCSSWGQTLHPSTPPRSKRPGLLSRVNSNVSRVSGERPSGSPTYGGSRCVVTSRFLCLNLVGSEFQNGLVKDRHTGTRSWIRRTRRQRCTRFTPLVDTSPTLIVPGRSNHAGVVTTPITREWCGVGLGGGREVDRGGRD